MTTTTANVARIIKSQIRVVTLMACGARDFTACKVNFPGEGEDHATAPSCDALRMKVGNGRRWVEIALRSDDTYTVTYFRVKRSDWTRVVLEQHVGVYCDMLDSVLYDVCHSGK